MDMLMIQVWYARRTRNWLTGFFLHFGFIIMWCKKSNFRIFSDMHHTVPMSVQKFGKSYTGCLQLLDIYWNLYGPPGNFCIKCWWSTALVYNHDKTGYRIAYLWNWSLFFMFAKALCCACHVFVLYLGKLVDSLHNMSWIFLKFILEICSVKFIDILLHMSPHHSRCLCSHHLSLPQPFTWDLKPICSTNPFLHSLSGSIWTASTDLGLGPD